MLSKPPPLIHTHARACARAHTHIHTRTAPPVLWNGPLAVVCGTEEDMVELLEAVGLSECSEWGGSDSAGGNEGSDGGDGFEPLWSAVASFVGRCASVGG